MYIYLYIHTPISNLFIFIYILAKTYTSPHAHIRIYVHICFYVFVLVVMYRKLVVCVAYISGAWHARRCNCIDSAGSFGDDVMVGDARMYIMRGDR